ncbi:MAG: tetratricopeptide repeat protein [Desulfobaccales bacterium]
MKRKARRLIVILVAFSLVGSGLGWAQDSDVVRLLNTGFDFLEQGNYNQAQKLYEELLKKDPTQPLALNNLGAIMVKQGKYDQALDYLRRALPRAKGFKVAIDRVCNVDSVCAACRISEKQFGSEDLDGVVRSNILMVEMAKSSKRGVQ